MDAQLTTKTVKDASALKKREIPPAFAEHQDKLK